MNSLLAKEKEEIKRGRIDIKHLRQLAKVRGIPANIKKSQMEKRILLFEEVRHQPSPKAAEDRRKMLELDLTKAESTKDWYVTPPEVTDKLKNFEKFDESNFKEEKWKRLNIEREPIDLKHYAFCVVSEYEW